MNALTPAEKAELMEALRTRRRSILMQRSPGPDRDPHLAQCEDRVERLMVWARDLSVTDG